jgi:predicted CxxxxCH...CXXCH cytochrome family protein
MGTKMKYLLLNILFTISLGIFIIGCSDLQSNIPVEPKLTVHRSGFTDPTSPNFHAKYIQSNNWDLQQCQSCHAADFSGGTTNESCNTCHSSPGGPAACNTCHGDLRNLSRIAPPRDINGDTATTVLGVGAHTSHLYTNSISTVSCSSCHNVPQSVFAPGHLDSSHPAPVILNGLATTNIANNATYNASDGTCSNNYCHGNFEYSIDSAAAEDRFAFTDSNMVGNNKTVHWTNAGNSEAACGTCHDLPPKGHIGYQQFPISSCISCHAEVVDAEGNIIDKTKHINGKVDVRGN